MKTSFLKICPINIIGMSKFKESLDICPICHFGLKYEGDVGNTGEIRTALFQDYCTNCATNFTSICFLDQGNSWIVYFNSNSYSLEDLTPIAEDYINTV